LSPYILSFGAHPNALTLNHPPTITQIERAVYRSFVAGEFACVGESLQSLPPELANTLTMQMGLTQLYLPRNHMSRFEAYGPKEARHLSAKHMMHVKVMKKKG
jgi:hypothetical protein